jgi:hypothetical protein
VRQSSATAWSVLSAVELVVPAKVVTNGVLGNAENLGDVHVGLLRSMKQQNNAAEPPF